MAEVAPETAHPAGARAGVATASADAPAGASANPWTLAEPRSPYAPPTAPVEHATDVYLDGHVVHAGFWKRVAAYLIDSVIIGVLSVVVGGAIGGVRSEEHTSELQSLMRISYAVFCLKKKKNNHTIHQQKIEQHRYHHTSITRPPHKQLSSIP